MIKKQEFNNLHHSKLSHVKANIKNYFKMMYLVFPDKVLIKIDGFILPKSSNKRLKTTSTKAKVKHTFSMILAKLIKA